MKKAFYLVLLLSGIGISCSDDDEGGTPPCECTQAFEHQGVIDPAKNIGCVKMCADNKSAGFLHFTENIGGNCKNGGVVSFDNSFAEIKNYDGTLRVSAEFNITGQVSELEKLSGVEIITVKYSNKNLATKAEYEDIHKGLQGGDWNYRRQTVLNPTAGRQGRTIQIQVRSGEVIRSIVSWHAKKPEGGSESAVAPKGIQITGSASLEEV